MHQGQVKSIGKLILSIKYYKYDVLKVSPGGSLGHEIWFGCEDVSRCKEAFVSHYLLLHVLNSFALGGRVSVSSPPLSVLITQPTFIE